MEINFYYLQGQIAKLLQYMELTDKEYKEYVESAKKRLDKEYAQESEERRRLQN